MTALSVDRLSKTFPGRPPTVALDDASLEVPAGSLVAVLGPSGCGKSTLLRCIAGFERPDAGTIRLGGRPVVADGLEVRPERRNVGIVPQEGALFPHLDVAGNIAFGLRSLDRATRSRRVGDLLELTDLRGLERRRPGELSGGQRQRVALARALAPQPDVVLLDEPFSALDADLRTSVRGEVAALLARTRTTALLVTHDQGEALAMADLVAVMRRGSIVQVAAPDDLYRRPIDLAAAVTIGSGTPVAAHATGTTAASALGTVTIDQELSGPVTLLVRPEQVRPDPAGPLVATVTAREFGGHDQLVHLDLGGTALVARWPAAVAAPTGSTHSIAIVGPVTAYGDGPRAPGPAEGEDPVGDSGRHQVSWSDAAG